jgi:hypothetical protein
MIALRTKTSTESTRHEAHSSSYLLLANTRQLAVPRVISLEPILQPLGGRKFLSFRAWVVRGFLVSAREGCKTCLFQVFDIG